MSNNAKPEDNVADKIDPTNRGALNGDEVETTEGAESNESSYIIPLTGEVVSTDESPKDSEIEISTGSSSTSGPLPAQSEATSQSKASGETITAKQEQTADQNISGASQTKQETKQTDDSKFFAIRTTGGQERVVANLLQTRVGAKKIGIRSILVLDSFKGYIIVEAPDSNVAYEALSGIRHVRGQIRGELPFKDIEGYLVKKPVVSELNIDDTVEVIAGPFKSMKAKITRVDYEKQEATVVLLDSPYQIPVTIDANYLKKLLH